MLLDTDDIIKEDMKNKYIPIDSSDVFINIVETCVKGILYGSYVTREGGLVDSCNLISREVIDVIDGGNPFKFEF